MVRPSCITVRISLTPDQMIAALIVTLFSGLSAASKGANGSVNGTFSMLTAMRYVFTLPMLVLSILMSSE